MSYAAALDDHDPGAAAAVFDVRPMIPSDLAFIRDSWLRSAWHVENRKLKRRGVKYRERIRAGRDWFDHVRPHVTALIEDSAVAVVVACDREDPAHIAGWIATRGDEVLRVYVKHAYRPWHVDELLVGAAAKAKEI